MLWYTNLCGTPGGGLVVPTSMAFLNFDSKNAVALSNFSTTGSAIVRLTYMVTESHPLKNGKGRVIDYNIFLISFPMLVSGVSCGVILNIIMPEEVINILYTIIYIILFAYMLYKTYSVNKKESLKKA